MVVISFWWHSWRKTRATLPFSKRKSTSWRPSFGGVRSPSSLLTRPPRLIAPLARTSAVVVGSILCLFLDFLLTLFSSILASFGSTVYNPEATVLFVCVCVCGVECALAAYLDRHRTTHAQHTLTHKLGKHVLHSCRCTAKHFHFEMRTAVDAASATAVCGSV